MFDTQPIDDLVRRFANSVPPGFSALREEFEKNIRATVQIALAKMELVTREEFDVQKAVLARTREKLESLERRVLAMEEQISGRN